MKRKASEKSAKNNGPTEPTQAERVIAKFGGARRLSAVLTSLGIPRDPATIYKWTYSRKKGGTGGLIPTSAWSDILLAAREEGILITEHDLKPWDYLAKESKSGRSRVAP